MVTWTNHVTSNAMFWKMTDFDRIAFKASFKL